MTHLSLSGLLFEVESPSALRLVGREIYLDYTGAGWLLNGEDETGEIFFEVPSRDKGAEWLAQAMQRAVQC